MERVPEPELMDDDAQAKAYAYADFEEPHEGFVDAFAERFADEPLKGAVLDLGCGPADVTIRFARRYPDAVVHGVDGADAMLRYGRELVDKAGLGARVELIKAYLPDDGPPRERYDAVISNSLLHHLADATVLWSSVARWADEGAPVFVMDLMRPASREEARRFVDTYADGEPEVLRHDFFHSLCAAYSLDEVTAQLQAAGLADALRVEAISDRHLVIWGRAPHTAPR
jgi:cyclopropane fatty-acyl-phospholipid synthase-like methyltransferase